MSREPPSAVASLLFATDCLLAMILKAKYLATAHTLQVANILLRLRWDGRRGRNQLGSRRDAVGWAWPSRSISPCSIASRLTSSLPAIRVETVARWRAAAPPGFSFSLKAWQVITHPGHQPDLCAHRLDPRDREHCGRFGQPTIRWAWDQTFAVATALGATLVLFQCPASFYPTKENLARLRQFFERAKRGRFAMGWEPGQRVGRGTGRLVVPRTGPDPCR